MEFNYQVTPDCHALYKNGNNFLEAAKRCLGVEASGEITIMDKDGFKILPAPVVVNAAFACEMFLKALILKSGNVYPRDKNGHNLKFLFDKLPALMKEKIIQFCIDDGDTATEQFYSFLSEHSSDFVDVRYYVTKEGWQGMSPFIVYTYTFNICNITKYLLDNWEVDSNG